MSKKELTRFFVVALVFLLSLAAVQADQYLDMQMRFFKGARKGPLSPPEMIMSSYLQPTITATIPSKFLLAEEKAQIQKVFNLEDVSLLTEVELSFLLKKNSEKPPQSFEKFRLNGRQYSILLIPQKSEFQFMSKGSDVIRSLPFRLTIFEIMETSQYALLDTQFILPEKNLAVFGFEDKEGQPYFLSFHITRLEGGPLPPPPPPSSKKYKDFVTEEEIDEFTRGAVVIEGDMAPPKRIKMVEPVYPEKARQARVEGIVILGVRIDQTGRVKEAKIYRSKDPLINEAAIAAVKQWVFEPFFLKGKPVDVVFTVTVNFMLVKGEGAAEQVNETPAPPGLKTLDTSPKIIKRVQPLYPAELRKAGIQGTVVLEVTTDEKGVPDKITVLKSESSELNQPSIDAVRQWVYEPTLIDGKPVSVTFTVTVRYKLK
ncbi:MAG: energy transducer TonB [Candidatus Aminicenantes bacterium]|nr:energy transducer TonB [Candidatus Aminicenantes bacterium]